MLMSAHRMGSYIIIIEIAIILFSVSCKEVAYSYGNTGGHLLENGNITEYNGSDIVSSAVSSAIISRGSIPIESRTVDDITKEINLKLNIRNATVREKGRRLILDYPGDGTISQICSIYSYMVDKWSFARDTRGIEEFQYSNESLELGKGKFSGQGDCDDFSILLASLIESIGGTSRIILAYGPMGGHAYTEVYLGKAEGIDSDADRMMQWLRSRYNAPEIYVHTDLETGDVWLNLDWWKDSNTGRELIKHPGGPFFEATNQTPILIRKDVAKIPLQPLNDLPIVHFAVSPTAPNEGEAVIFNASFSRDIGIDGQIVRYIWNFGDEKTAEGKISSHVYSQDGTYLVNLTAVDNDGGQNSTNKTVTVNALPVPVIYYKPKEPMARNQVSLDASKSWDREDKMVSRWLWEFGDEGTGKRSRVSHTYDEPGIYIINLTVYDNDNASNKTSLALKINDPPVARFTYSSDSLRRYLNEGETITFDASESEDHDGNMTNYQWNFDDGSSTNDREVVTHKYATGGNFTVRLEITDDNNATAIESKTLQINWLPVARISPIVSPHAPKEDIIFDASNSSDMESKILKYSWDFNNDSIIDSGAKRDAYSYRLFGHYNAKLTVTDENGASNSSSINLMIEEPDSEQVFVSASPNNSSSQIETVETDWLPRITDEETDYRAAVELSDKGAKLCILGRYDDALDYLNRAIQLNESIEYAWFNRAIVLIMKDNCVGAINDSDKALELNMSDAEALSNKGRAITCVHSPEKAIPWFDMAIDVNPNLAEAWYGKADALSSMERYDEAAVCYDKAIEINGSSRKLQAEVLYEKARSQYFHGKAENDTQLINSSYDIYKKAVEMGYVLGYTQDRTPFGFRAFEISWRSLVHPRMSTDDKTSDLRRIT